MARTFAPLTVFTKPWKALPVGKLAEFIRGLGFDGIELPVRPGFQVEPERMPKGLPAAVRTFAESGLTVPSIAGTEDERMIAACGDAGVGIIRVCVRIDMAKGYLPFIDGLRRKYDALVPLLEKHRVAIGIQNHEGPYITSAVGILHAIEPFDPKHVNAVLDPAHCCLAGEPEEMALDIVWDRLSMVNLKNAVRKHVPASGNEPARWKVVWTPGREGFCSWPKVAAVLRKRGFTGPVCLTAEYSDEAAVDRLVAEDVSFAKELLS